MHEVQFLKENYERWVKFEKTLSGTEDKNPDYLIEQYSALLDDLSYARTNFPKSKTTKYLNKLAQQLHRIIYQTKQEEVSRFKNFWVKEVPEAYSRNFNKVLVSLAIMLFSVGIGWLSSSGDADFVRLILGDAYVNMTESNIESGDPMAVYANANQIDMFFGITFHNIMVSFTAFAYGFLLSLGTVYILLMNGIMLGSFHYFFFEKGLFFETAATIWIHGTIEISSIILAGAAGITIGNSILFPGTYKRMESLKKKGRDALKMVVGLVPFFVIAGFLESFVTRYHEMPVILKLIIHTLSFSLIVWYFFIYPYKMKQERNNV